jgi:hypothetical protein
MENKPRGMNIVKNKQPDTTKLKKSGMKRVRNNFKETLLMQ